MRTSAARRPIGIFDSGIGGLTVFKALSRRMPAEDLIYFGDTARVPYGSKSPEAVTRYSLEVARYLAARRVKLLVVACNTSSAIALKRVQACLDIPVLGVIEPGARAAARASSSGRIGVVGTQATIDSGAYTRALKARRPGVFVTAQACPVFVPLVEEGWWVHPATTAAARQYLAPLKAAGVDALILGCTHYPLLKATLRRVMGPSVRLIDSAEETALEAEGLLGRLGLLKKSGRGSRRFTASDAPARFLRLARRLGVAVKKVELHRFD
ncbi:MAG: glutamate racemase [Elusimicrobiota bacterium]